MNSKQPKLNKKGGIMGELSKRNLKLTNDRKQRDDEIAKLKRELVEQQRINNVLMNENSELTGKINKHDQAQKDGYLAIATDKNGMVTHIAEVQGYSEYTYVQPIPIAYGSKNYKRYPVLELEQGQLRINSQKLKKYKTIGVI